MAKYKVLLDANEYIEVDASSWVSDIDGSLKFYDVHRRTVGLFAPHVWVAVLNVN